MTTTRTTASPLDAESERLFALMDADGDGQITEAEGRTVADAFGCNASTFWKLLLKYDADGDGTISRGEFSEALKGRVLQAFFPRHKEKDFGAVIAAAIQALGGAVGPPNEPPAAVAQEDARRIAKEAAAALAAAGPLKLCEDDEIWRGYGGADLAATLRCMKPCFVWCASIVFHRGGGVICKSSDH